MHYPSRLSNGTYYILDSSQSIYVGRSLSEDLSVSPKPVVSTAPTNDNARPKWSLQRRPEGRYTLRLANAPVRAVNGALFAFLHPLHMPAEWVITHHQGNLYTIETTEGTASWVLPQNVGLYAQILISTQQCEIGTNSTPSIESKTRMFTIVEAR